MSIEIKKKNFVKKQENIQSNSVTKNLTKKSIATNFDLNFSEGAEAYYSERYGWTLRRTK